MRKTLSFLLLLLVPFVLAAAPSVRLEIKYPRGKNTIQVGDNFYIIIKTNGVSASGFMNPSTVPGGSVNYYDFYSEESYGMSQGNGTMTVRANAEGNFKFGPITVGGVKSNVVSYTIGTAGSGAKQSLGQGNDAGGNVADNDGDADKPKFIGRGDDNLFMKATASLSSVYEQQAIVYTVKVYTSYDAIKFLGAAAAPKFDGFVVEDSKDVSSSWSFETVNGKTYKSAVIAKYIIFPQVTGKLKISGNTYTVSVDRYEYYHDRYYGTFAIAQPLQLNVTPNDIVVDVKPLPFPKPAGFSGGVGKFRLMSGIKSTQLKTNQAASIVYTVTGEGNLKYVQLPDLAMLYPPSIEVYTPKVTQNVVTGSTNTSGTVTYDYSFMPLEEGSVEIPQVTLVYFNPETGRYESSAAKGYSLTVGKGASVKSTGIKHPHFNRQWQPIGINGLKGEPADFVDSFLFWLWYLLPSVLLAIGLLMRRRYIKIHADIASLNSRRAGRLASRRLKKANKEMKKENREAFYTELLKALWGYMGDKLKMPVSELVRDNIRQVLQQRGITEDETEKFIEAIDNAEFAKYSSAGVSGTMQQAYDNAAAVIASLNNSFRKAEGKDNDSQNGNYNKFMNNVLRLMFPLIALLSGFSPVINAHAANTEEILSGAEDAYRKGNYSETVQLLDSIIRTGKVSAPLYADMGNACAAAGDYAGAMISYINALRLDPGNVQVRQNMAYVQYRVTELNKKEVRNRKASFDSDGQSFFASVGHTLTHRIKSNTWAILSVILFLLVLACIGIYVAVPFVTLRKVSFFATPVLFILSVVSIVMSIAASRVSKDTKEAVLTAQKVLLLEEPEENANTNPIPLIAGTVVDVLDVKDDPSGKPKWMKIRLNSTFVGWIPASSAVIPQIPQIPQ